MARILVTGASGFVGRALVANLRSKDHVVLPVVRSRVYDEDIAVGDIGEYQHWDSLLANVDVVVHLAARAHVVAETLSNPLDEFRRVNVEPTVRLARASARQGVRRFVFLSSIGVNGSFTTDHAFSESDVPNPAEPYAISKWEAEQALIDIGAQTGLAIVRVRPPLIVGAGAKGNLLRIVRLADSRVPLPLGRVKNVRSFVAVEDLCELLELCCLHPQASSDLFMAADARTISTPELVRAIREELGRVPLLVPVPLPLLFLAAKSVGAAAEIRRLTSSLLVDARHAREVLSWTARIGIRAGIRAMVRSYVSDKAR